MTRREELENTVAEFAERTELAKAALATSCEHSKLMDANLREAVAELDGITNTANIFMRMIPDMPASFDAQAAIKAIQRDVAEGIVAVETAQQRAEFAATQYHHAVADACKAILDVEYARRDLNNEVINPE